MTAYPRLDMRCLLLAIGAALACPAHAGRPLSTDDAAIVDTGACQIESWVETTRDGHAYWAIPGCNLFGHAEFSLGAARIRPDGLPGYTLGAWQVKGLLRPYGQDVSGFAVAVGGQRVRHGTMRDDFVNGIATVPLGGDRRLLHLNLGVLRLRDEDGHRTRATWGLAYDAEVNGATRAALETFGRSGERANWQLGLRHDLVPGRVQIDGSIGGAIGRWNGSRVFTLGLVFAGPLLRR